MSPLLLLIPLLAALAVLAGSPEASPPPPRPAVTIDAGAAAYDAAKEHLAAGRLGMASYFFDQAARHGFRRADSLRALAYVHYLQDNLEGGDAALAAAEPGESLSEWAAVASRERDAAMRRREAHPR